MNQPDEVRIGKIIRTINQLIAYIDEHHITEEQVLNDYATQWTITTPLYNIGEHTYQLSKELKAQWSSVPWSQIAGMRHRLVHQYDDTNWDTISYVIFNELKPYLEQLEQISNKDKQSSQ